MNHEDRILFTLDTPYGPVGVYTYDDDAIMVEGGCYRSEGGSTMYKNGKAVYENCSVINGVAYRWWGVAKQRDDFNRDRSLVVWTYGHLSSDRVNIDSDGDFIAAWGLPEATKGANRVMWSLMMEVATDLVDSDPDIIARRKSILTERARARAAQDLASAKAKLAEVQAAVAKLETK